MQQLDSGVPTPTNSTVGELAKVKCLACDMIQLEAELCRRCKKKLPKPIIREVIKEIQTVVTMDVALFGPRAPVLPMVEYERRAIIHALKRFKSGQKAARALGIGKTQIYRKFIQYEIDIEKYIKRQRSGDLSPEEIRSYVQTLYQSNMRHQSKLALHLLLLTLVQGSALRLAKWEHVNFVRGEWEIPAERTKDHKPRVVYLCPQTARLLRELHALAGDSESVLPGVKHLPRQSIVQLLSR